MATESMEAVYERGGFRPIAPEDMDLTEGQRVRLVVEPIWNLEDILAFAAQVHDGFSDGRIDSIEQLSRRRDCFFGKWPSE